MTSVPFRKIVCEFGPVRSGPFRKIVDPINIAIAKIMCVSGSVGPQIRPSIYK